MAPGARQRAGSRDRSRAMDHSNSQIIRDLYAHVVEDPAATPWRALPRCYRRAGLFSQSNKKDPSGPPKRSERVQVPRHYWLVADEGFEPP